MSQARRAEHQHPNRQVGPARTPPKDDKSRSGELDGIFSNWSFVVLVHAAETGSFSTSNVRREYRNVLISGRNW